MSNWIFTVTQHKVDGELLLADDILNQRMADQFWGLGEKTPNRRSLKKGDFVVFYVGLPRKVFAASAQLDSDSFELNKEQKEKYGHNKKLLNGDIGCGNCNYYRKIAREYFEDVFYKIHRTNRLTNCG